MATRPKGRDGATVSREALDARFCNYREGILMMGVMSIQYPCRKIREHGRQLCEEHRRLKSEGQTNTTIEPTPLDD